jgi:novobiocin biosynthesis protein NovU/D-mycarose 3-C-methyltransferase
VAERTRCGACGGTRLKRFLDLGKTPLANTLPTSREQTETYYPLGLCRCANCDLVQNIEVVPDELIYNASYAFYSGGSPAQRAYQRRSAEILLDRHGAKARQGVVEIACNDGTLLQYLAEAGCPVTGIDPSSGPAEMAIEAGLDVTIAPFTQVLAREIRTARGPAGLIIAYNVLAHVDDLSGVLAGIWELLADDGVAVVEVQYLPDLIAGNAIGQIYHEHRYFWSLSTFQRAAQLHGLFVIDAQLIEYQNGGMRVTLGTRSNWTTRRVERILRSERWLEEDSAYDSVQGRIDRNRDHLLNLIQLEREEGRTVVGYAASAKACTILNYTGISLPYVIDTTPHKWGKFVPGTKTPIVSPTEADEHDTRLLLTSNYLGYLLRHDEFEGRWIVAEPLPMVV